MFPDFAMYELLDQHRIMDPTCLEGYSRLKAFMDRFEVCGAHYVLTHYDFMGTNGRKTEIYSENFFKF